MSNDVRRRAVLQLVAGSACFAAAARASAATVDETDETAIALGYRHETAKVDATKFTTHAPSQQCANCGFWQGAASDAWAGCSMFGRKQVANGGWCAAWRKP